MGRGKACHAKCSPRVLNPCAHAPMHHPTASVRSPQPTTYARPQCMPTSAVVVDEVDSNNVLVLVGHGVEVLVMCLQRELRVECVVAARGCGYCVLSCSRARIPATTILPISVCSPSPTALKDLPHILNPRTPGSFPPPGGHALFTLQHRPSQIQPQGRHSSPHRCFLLP